MTRTEEAVTEVRIAAVPAHLRHMQRYVGRIGTMVGLSGQFVAVRFDGEGERMSHLFLPNELEPQTIDVTGS